MAVAFSLKFQRNNQQSALTMDSANGKADKKDVFFTMLQIQNNYILIEPIKKALSSHVVVSSPQCGQNTAFFSVFPLGGIHSQGILSVNPLEL